MATIGSSIAASVSGGLTPSTAPTITNLALSATPTTEGSHTLATNLKQLLIRPRQGNAKLQFAFVATESATKYITIEKGCGYFVDKINLTGKTLYIQSDKASTIVEILEWT